nr:uncharacterized protein LOC127313912 [Lolium perenne]
MELQGLSPSCTVGKGLAAASRWASRLHSALPGGRPPPPRAAGLPVSMARRREGPRRRAPLGSVSMARRLKDAHLHHALQGFRFHGAPPGRGSLSPRVLLPVGPSLPWSTTPPDLANGSAPLPVNSRTLAPRRIMMAPADIILPLFLHLNLENSRFPKIWM